MPAAASRRASGGPACPVPNTMASNRWIVDFSVAICSSRKDLAAAGAEILA